LCKYIPAPDFPTKGIIMGGNGIKEMYRTGRGSFIIRSKADIEEYANGSKTRIVITEIPYEVVKIHLVRRIDEVRFNKEIWGIEEVRDESDMSGLKIVIDITDEANADLILKYLYKNTDLQVSYNFNVVTIDNRTPRLTGILDILDSYIAHQKDVVLRRSKFDYNKCADKLHIDEGLIKAISILDDVIATIRASHNKAESKQNLINKFKFTERQAEAIVMLQLYRLSSTDISIVEQEIASLKKQMESLSLIINNENALVISECQCSITNDSSNERYLRNLSESLQYIYNDDIIGHKNFIQDSLYNWAEYLYDYMSWKID
jgi:topoisomerase-4 subunit A